MQELVINKREIRPSDVLVVLGDAFAAYLYFVCGSGIGFIPLMVLLTLDIAYRLVLSFKWLRSSAITVDNDEIVFNHTLLLNKVRIPLSEIESYDKTLNTISIKASARKALPAFHKSGAISLHTLTQAECRELFSVLDTKLK